MKKTKIEIEATFWAIVRIADPQGYQTGIKSDKTFIFEFDSAIEMDEKLADGCVEAGESMGDFIFDIKAQSVGHRELARLVEYEKEEK